MSSTRLSTNDYRLTTCSCFPLALSTPFLSLTAAFSVSVSARSSWAFSTSRPIPLPRPDTLDTRREPSTPRCAMEADGADLLDIGGESTRPGAAPVLGGRGARPRPPGHSGAGRARCAFRSQSTPTRPQSRAPCLAEGAAMVNDVSGLRYDRVAGGGGRRRRRGARADAQSRAVRRPCMRRRDYDDVVGEVDR